MASSIRSQAVHRKRQRAWWLEKLFPEGWGSVTRHIAAVVLIVWALFSLFPLYWTVITSLKPPQDISSVRPTLIITRFSLENYVRFLKGVGISNAPVAIWVRNSVLVTTATTLLTLLVCSWAGYAFARKKFWGRDVLFWTLIFTTLIPQWTVIAPLYVLTHRWKLHDNFWGLILPALSSPFSVFLVRQFVVTLPEELFAAARVDGASEFQLWSKITLPLSRPVLGTLGIFTLIGTWNDFLWPMLILNKSRKFTLLVGAALLQYQFQGAGPNYGLSMAVSVLMSIVPVTGFIIMQRQMIRGLTVGVLKG